MVNIINQPFSDRLGNKIIEFLNRSGTERFDKFYILSAFVKKSGLSRIQEALLNFKNNGGIIKAVAGINQGGSTKDGLLLLKQLSNNSYIYYNENSRISFHPKMYIFEKSDKAVVFIGSSNLTSGGLFMNYELDSMIEFNLTQESERNAFSEYLSIFQRYSNPTQPTCKELTNDLIENLDRRRMLGSEELLRSVTTTSEHEEGEEVEPLFGSESFGAPPPAYEEPTVIRETPLAPPPPTTAPAHIAPTTAQDPWELKGQLVWRKSNLPASDVLQTRTSNTNPTGSLRFVKAGWRVGGRLIDQTRYFRHDVFGRLRWGEERPEPFQEITSALFHVRLLGVDKGQHRLFMRHKPSGEAGQNNFTTAISWGELSEEIRRNDLRGRSFYLYAPPVGQNEPFYIEIN